MNESKKTKKVVRNDEGKVVPEHCSCGGKIGVFIEGEPIYKCTACGKYYGTMPFRKKALNESLNKENKNMKKNAIKINESQLRNIVVESVKKVLNEIGDTSKGQKALGALAQRQAMDDDNYDVRNPKCPAVKTYKHAEKSRGGDSYDNQGRNKNPLYKDYAKGSVEYMNAHTNDLAKSNLKKRMTESQLRKVIEESVKNVLNEYWDEEAIKKHTIKEAITPERCYVVYDQDEDYLPSPEGGYLTKEQAYQFAKEKEEEGYLIKIYKETPRGMRVVYKTNVEDWRKRNGISHE